MKRLLRLLLQLHLRHAKGIWIAVALVTLALGLGVLRVERRLDLMSLLPTDHPVVKASIQAGVGQQELLWLVAEGTPETLEVRQAWAEQLVERLLTDHGMPINGMSGEGRLSQPVPVPEAKGASLWPPLLAAGSLLEADPMVGRLLTEQFYALAPMLLGDRLAPLKDPEHLRQALRATSEALRSPQPATARMAQMDPLGLRAFIPEANQTADRATQSARAFPLKLKTGYLETKDARYVLVPLVLDFPSGEGAATAKVLTWLAKGAEGPMPPRAGLGTVEAALASGPDRPWPIQATGAHAIAYWESQRLGREVVLSLVFSFILIGLVYWIGFRTLAGYGFVVIPLLLGMFWALGMVGWMLGRLNLMAAAFGAVLLGVGDDVGILIFSRYRDERHAGCTKPLALRAALLGSGPGVIAGAVSTALAFLACAAAPFPGFRDLGVTAGLGLLACLVASFLVLPLLLLAFDRGRGSFAPVSEPAPRRKGTTGRKRMILALALLVVAAVGAFRVTWEEDLRRFRQAGNPALVLQETLGKVLGAGLQPLAIELPLDDPERLPRLWNKVIEPLRREGLPMPAWASFDPELRLALGSETWYAQVLKLAQEAGLDPAALERPLAALRASASDPAAVPRALQAVLAPSRSAPEQRWSVAQWLQRKQPEAPAAPSFLLPLRLPEAAQDRIEGEIEAAGARMVGTRPLFRAVKTVAKEALLEVVLLAFGAVLAIITLFGRRPRFIAYALIPLLASQAGVLGSLGWSGEPLTFLSLVAIPIALGVSVDVSMNLLHRARLEPGAAARVARVNAVCAGTTLAGFGGLVFSSYRGLRGLGLAALGGTALALIINQWLLPWMLEKWPLRKRS